VAAFAPGVQCVTSSDCTEASGAPLVSTTTNYQGVFTLTDVPVGTNIPLVIQVGRFRRQVTIPQVTACVTTNTAALSASPTCLSNGKTCSTAGQCCSNSCSKTNGTNPICDPLTRLPKNQTEGDIPKMAFVTGDVDGLECVWRKIGIDDSQFTNPSGTGRVNFYQGGGSPGTYIGTAGTHPTVTNSEITSGTGTANASTPWEDALVGNPTTLAEYDMVFFPCQGAQYYWNHQTTYETNIANYVNEGGRVFTTHYSYIWLYSDNADSGGVCKTDGATCTSNGSCCSLSCKTGKCVSNYSSPLSGAITWGINQSDPSPDPGTGYINTTFAKGLELAEWLQFIGASTTQGQISINTLRRDFNAVVSPTELWMTVNSSTGTPMEATFNTPITAASTAQCGRVVHSDFHVETSNNTHLAFPQECPGGGATPQELLLANMLFDLAACVTPDVPPTCVGITCNAQGLDCGMAGDGCGNTINCGNCPTGEICGAAGLGMCGKIQ
jgi:hypothetical protein